MKKEDLKVGDIVAIRGFNDSYNFKWSYKVFSKYGMKKLKRISVSPHLTHLIGEELTIQDGWIFKKLKPPGHPITDVFK